MRKPRPFDYTPEEQEWLKVNCSAREWKNTGELVEVLNKKFGTSRTESALNSYICHHNIPYTSKVSKYTAEQEKWIAENCSARVWKNMTEFTDAFNNRFGTKRKADNICQHLYRRKLFFNCVSKTNVKTDEENKWLVENIDKYDGNFVILAKDFNERFGRNTTNYALAKYCEKHLKIWTPARKTEMRNAGMKKKGEVGHNGLPVGTIRYNSDGRPFIKVMDCEGKAGKTQGGHNYREPFWKPLQKKIWEDHYGEVPKGKVVCSLNGNPCDTDINHIALIDKKATGGMAKNGWWSDEIEITRTGIAYWNLFYAMGKGKHNDQGRV